MRCSTRTVGSTAQLYNIQEGRGGGGGRGGSEHRDASLNVEHAFNSQYSTTLHVVVLCSNRARTRSVLNTHSTVIF